MILNLSVYSNYRTHIMGLAAIMIIICHIRGIDYSRVPVIEKYYGLVIMALNFSCLISYNSMNYRIN